MGFTLLKKDKKIDQENQRKEQFVLLFEKRFDDLFYAPFNDTDYIIFSYNQQKLYSDISKLVSFYSSLINHISRHRQGGFIIMSLISKVSDILNNLTLVYNSSDSDREDFYVYLSYKVSKALLFLSLFLEMMSDIEGNGWLNFKSEKRIILDFVDREFKDVDIKIG